ncbi:MAG: sigma-70 family RNA polymerase sigma factor [Bacteroidia bacterium]|nr:sigma-70 family RNA polymerase sigma factor [Bacteroidia bacterium]
MQEVFLRVWESRTKLPMVKVVKAYLLTMMRNISFDALKKEHKFLSPEHTNANKAEGLSRRIHHSRTNPSGPVSKIHTALAKLSPRQQEIIHLRFFSEAEYEEICQIMQIDYQSARDLLHRAIKALRRKLHPATLKLLEVIGLLSSMIYFI